MLRSESCGWPTTFCKVRSSLGPGARRGLVECDNQDLSIGQQCALLSIPRSSFYYLPQGETEQNLTLMWKIDEKFLEAPFFGIHPPLGTSLSDTLPGVG